MQKPQNYQSTQSWLAVAGGFFSFFCTVGFSNAFGVFQDHYKTFLGRSSSDISWIGSVGVAFAMLFGPAVGMVTDKYGPRIPLYIGSLGLLLAIFTTSLGTQYYQIFLSQGVLVGLSSACLMNPPLAVISRRMPHRRGLAFGFAIGGSSVGGIIWPIMLQELLYKHDIGFGWAMRAAGFVMILPLCFSCMTIRNPQAAAPTARTEPIQQDSVEKQNGPNVVSDGQLPKEKSADFAILKRPAFVILCIGLSCSYLGLMTPLFFISSYAIDQGVAPGTAFNLLAGLNAASLFGRLLPGILADRYGHFNLCAMAAFSAGLVAFCWTKATSLAGIVMLALAYGFASGGVMSLQSACAGKLANAGNQGVAIGCAMGSIAVTALVGTPISGQILATSGYLGLSVWSGATLVGASVILLAARFTADPRIIAAF